MFARQEHQFGLISWSIENLRKLGKEKITKSAVETRLSQLDHYFAKFEATHDALIEFSNDAKYMDQPYFRDNLFCTCEEVFLNTKAELAEMLLSFSTSGPLMNSTIDQNNSNLGSVHTSRALPKITLPKFSGKYQDWIPFRDLFLSMVGSNPDIKPVEKLHYLKTNVTDDAAKIIAGISITDENYARAWEKLKARYENKRVLINTQLDILFALKPVSKRCAKELECLRSIVAEVLESLESLGAQSSTWDCFIVYFVSRRLDPETLEDWEMQLKGTTEPPAYTDLNSFLEGCIRALENVDARLASVKKPTLLSAKSTSNSRVFTSVTSTPCACCGAPHFVSTCPTYKAKTPEQRRDFVTAKRLCYNCLGTHPVVRCTSVKRCLVCRQAHHTTIHVRSSAASVSNDGATNQRSSTSTHNQPHSQSSSLSPAATPFNPTHVEPQSIAPGSSASSHHALPSTGTNIAHYQTLLPTAQINVLSLDGIMVTSRALLDQGSELSFVNENVVQRLQLPRRHSAITLFGIGASKQLTTRGAVSLRFQSVFEPEIEYVIEAHVIPKITRRIPSYPVTMETLPHLASLKFADPSFATPGPVEILLGANVYGQLLREDLRRDRVDMPVGQLTTLGWIVSGPISNFNSNSTSAPGVPHTQAQGFLCKATCDLNDLVHQFWEQETIIVPDTVKSSKEDTFCENHFVRTCTRNPDGRYTVRLPFKTKPVHFGDIRTIAERMLASTHRRFQRDAEFRHLYVDFLEVYEKMGHMQRIEDRQEKDSFYLPHHGVLRHSSLTTKLRVVFNGSQATGCGSTLNEC